MKPLIYLDNAATSHPKPSSVVLAVTRAIERLGNPGRGGGPRTVAATRLLFETRELIAGLFRLDHPERIAFTANATEGVNLALKGLLRRGDRVVHSLLEHNAVIRPLGQLKRRGVQVVAAVADEAGLPDPRQLPDNMRALVVTAASNVTGAMPDLAALGVACRQRGALLIVDAAQAAGAAPLDTSCIDVLICTGHKSLLGPQGSGFVWFGPGVDPEPLIAGGTGSDSDNADMPDYFPDHLEAGTQNIPGIAGLRAGLLYIKKRGVESIRQMEVNHCHKMIEILGNDDRIEIYPPFDAARRASLVSFNIRGADPVVVAQALQRAGITVRAGLHCAPLAHEILGTWPVGAIRVSPGPFSKTKEIDTFCTRLHHIAKRLGRK